MLLVILLASLATAQQQKADSDDPSKALLRHVGWYNPQSTEIVFALSMDLATAHLPGGILAARTCGEHETEFVPAKDSTLEDELHRISDLKPDYQWNLDDGVLNFFPKLLSPSPLDIPIKEFTVGNEPVEQAYRVLFESADVKSGLLQLGLHEPVLQVLIGPSTPPNIGGASAPPKELKRITLNLKNTTLREASNANVRADGRKTWVLSVVSCKGDNTYSYQLVN